MRKIDDGSKIKKKFYFKSSYCWLENRANFESVQAWQGLMNFFIHLL